MNEHRNASNQLTIDFNDIEMLLYSKITKEIINLFDLNISSEKVKGLDEIFQEFSSGKSIISIEWDNWSGYIVTAINKEAEPLAKEIAKYVNKNYQNKK